MRLLEMRDEIDASNQTDPWTFDGTDFLETMTLVRLPEGELIPPFPENLELPFPFLLVDHVAHVPETSVLAFTTLHDLEREILSDSGLTNFFITHSVAFVDGGTRRFRILYQDEAGKDVVFSKAGQIATNKFSNVYANRRLQWL
jgi:hypothetical protein